MRVGYKVRNTLRDLQKLGLSLKDLGFSGFREEWVNQQLLWDLPSNAENTNEYTPTSISDNDQYRNVCLLAAKNKDIQAIFKSNRQYRLILEHVTAQQGQQYFSLIRHNAELLEKLLQICAKEFGRPLRYSITGLGKVSPTQIRYAKILQDLQFLFGDLSGKNIAEIGIGNGGQAIHILNSYPTARYSGFDLDVVLNLSSQLVKMYNSNFEVDMFDGINPPKKEFDLILSNYAFSELNLETQQMYIEKVISNSKSGYMIYNHIQPSGSKAMTATEFAQKIPGAEIFQEIPNTFKKNVLVVWGHNQGLPVEYFKKV
jgi:hypothetical protein